MAFRILIKHKKHFATLREKIIARQDTKKKFIN